MKEILVLIEALKLVKSKKTIQKLLYDKHMAKHHINKRRRNKEETTEEIEYFRSLKKQYDIPANPRATYNDIDSIIVMVLDTGTSGTTVLNIFAEENNKSKRWRKVIARERAGKLFKQILLSYKEHPAIIRMIDNKMYNEKDILNSSLTGALRKLSKLLALSNAKDADKNDKVILIELLAVKKDTSSKTKTDWSEVQAYRDKGLTVRVLANTFGVSPAAVSKYTKKLISVI
jgi:hypothetical protein